MIAIEDKELETCHKAFLGLCFADFPIDKTYNIVSDNITGYGTNINEKIECISDFIDLLNLQREESESIEMKFILNRISKTVFSEGTGAVLVDAGIVKMTIEGKQMDLSLRVSSIYEYINSKWMVVHFHGSIPQGVEGDRDTWAVNEWKEKNAQLEKIIEERTNELSQSLEHLKATQDQLIQSEKMASLGELTAGIAHEIQNPLNFVNNFSELSTELIDEMKDELDHGDIEEAKAISEDIKQNLKKINHHGKRADSIVKGMLQHSRNSNNTKEATDINALADEYMRLAYHGLRAKDKSFNSNLESDFDDTIESIEVIPQDIGRVILNLFTNAFYAVSEKKASLPEAETQTYEPTVSVTTKKTGQSIHISVRDNGDGIPKEALNKIFQPFFTTKPTGKGTGLGLSMSYDIIKAHGGNLEVKTEKGEYTEFTLILPIKTKTA